MVEAAGLAHPVPMVAHLLLVHLVLSGAAVGVAVLPLLARAAAVLRGILAHKRGVAAEAVWDNPPACGMEPQDQLVAQAAAVVLVTAIHQTAALEFMVLQGAAAVEVPAIVAEALLVVGLRRADTERALPQLQILVAAAVAGRHTHLPMVVVLAALVLSVSGGLNKE